MNPHEDLTGKALEQLDTALCEPIEPLVGITGMMKGSITFAPDQSKPCYCANCVVLEQDIARLRLGNAAVIHDNQRLQHEVARLERDLAGAMIRINELKNKQFVGGV